MSWLMVALGGALGALGRYCVFLWVQSFQQISFPWATLSVNVLGSFLLGTVVVLVLKEDISISYRLLMMTGFLGAFTTFSTYSLETWMLFKEGHTALAFINVGVQNIVSLVAVGSGWFLCSKYYM